MESVDFLFVCVLACVAAKNVLVFVVACGGREKLPCCSYLIDYGKAIVVLLRKGWAVLLNGAPERAQLFFFLVRRDQGRGASDVTPRKSMHEEDCLCT